MEIDWAGYAREHVCYEVRMLVQTYHLLPQAYDMVEKQAASESFKLHARNLDAFLGQATSEPGEVLARRYVDTWQPKHPLTSELRRSVSKGLAHLTEDRVNKESFQVLAVLAAVAAGFGQFLAELPPERRPWFAEARGLLAAVPPVVVAKAAAEGGWIDAQEGLGDHMTEVLVPETRSLHWVTDLDDIGLVGGSSD